MNKKISNCENKSNIYQTHLKKYSRELDTYQNQSNNQGITDKQNN